MRCKYAGCDDESAWYVKSADLENYTISYGQRMERFEEWKTSVVATSLGI